MPTPHSSDSQLWTRIRDAVRFIADVLLILSLLGLLGWLPHL